MELDGYKKFYRDGNVITVKFVQADLKNLLFRMEDNGVSVILPMDDAFFGKKRVEYAAYAPGVLGQSIQVLVKEVNEETKTVVCTHHEYMKRVYEMNKARIEKALDAGERVEAKARVIGIYGKGKKSFAIVRLKDSGLLGVVWCEDWSTEYTTDIADVAKAGEQICVVIMGENTSTTAKAKYRCSRTEALENPWAEVNGKIHKGDIVNARILEKWNKGFSGKVEGFKDITAWVSLPENGRFRLIEGLMYQCEVTAVDGDKKRLILKPFKLCYVD